MIVWERDPSRYPDEDEMTQYKGGEGFRCPHCEMPLVVETDPLDRYLDNKAMAVITDKLLKGYAVFYCIEYLGHFKEDEFEYGNEDSGHYSFQC